ncbi:MAG: WbqC family protein [Archangiaceae bacterium]|nr:WbqC family protein [Archangiaceae bacterium]
MSGAGGRHYLTTTPSTRAGVAVEYMAHVSAPYPQRHGEFTPFVPGARTARQLRRPRWPRLFTSQTLSWKEPVS